MEQEKDDYKLGTIVQDNAPINVKPQGGGGGGGQTQGNLTF